MNLTFWVDFLEAGRFYAIRGDAQGLCLALWSGITPGGDFMWHQGWKWGLQPRKARVFLPCKIFRLIFSLPETILPGLSHCYADAVCPFHRRGK